MDGTMHLISRRTFGPTLLLVISFYFIFLPSSCNMPSQPTIVLLSQKQLPDFPSASAIDFYKERLYVTGDDARYLAILDTSYNLLDTVTLFPGTELRIPKKLKADLEASAIISHKGVDYLLTAGSSSTAERELIYLFPMNDLRAYRQISTTVISQAFRAGGIREVNIEGAVAFSNQIVFGNRGNLTNRHNHLILVPQSLLDGPLTGKPAIISLDFPGTGNAFIGLSGLTYIPSRDMLLFTASIEQTASATEDGLIGDSYLGYIKDFSRKTGNASIQPDQLMNLGQMQREFANQKIESVCAQTEEGQLILHLVADNDDGTSTLFKISLDPAR
jgi:hypothetical protein